MKPDASVIQRFYTVYKQVYKFTRQDCEALAKMGGQDLLIEALWAKQKYLYGFIINYEQQRYKKAKVLNKTHDRTQSNQILQQDDQKFWSDLTEEQFMFVAQHAAMNAAKAYGDEIRLIIPEQMRQDLDQQVKYVPHVPLTKDDYLKQLAQKQ